MNIVLLLSVIITIVLSFLSFPSPLHPRCSACLIWQFRLLFLLPVCCQTSFSILVWRINYDSKVLMCNCCVCVYFFFYPCLKGFKSDLKLTKSHYIYSCRFILPFLYFCPPLFCLLILSSFSPPSSLEQGNRRKPQALLPHIWPSNGSRVGGRSAAGLTPSRCGTRCAQLTTVKRELPLLLSSPAICIFGMF